MEYFPLKKLNILIIISGQKICSRCSTYGNAYVDQFHDLYQSRQLYKPHSTLFCAVNHRYSRGFNVMFLQ